MFTSQCSTLKRESNITNCNNTFTCTKCTINDQCQWSLQLQKCISISKTLLNSTRLIVSNAEKCPRFSVVKNHYYSNRFIYLDFIVKISNDNFTLMGSFQNSYTCTSSSTIMMNNHNWKKFVNYSEIICSASVSMRYLKYHNKHSLTEFISIKFDDDILLRFDDVVDHYATLYKHECDKSKENEYCASCTWTKDNGYSYFVRLCSFNNSCEGHNEFYKSHNGKGQFWNSNSLTIKDECAEINVMNFNPLSGPQGRDMAATITVRNHMVFAENRKLTVMVAGADCINLKMSGPETITCTISPSFDYICEKLTGPILVMYSSNESKLTIESSQIFEFYVDNTFGVPILSTDCSLRYPESEHTKAYDFNFRSKCIHYFATTMLLILFCLLIIHLIGYLRMYQYNALNTGNA